MPLVKPNLPPRPSSSVDKQERLLPTFVQCPRSTFQEGLTDWYHITTPKKFSNLDICSTCYNATFRNTPYARCISPAPPKPKGMATQCDLSFRWNRAATFWLFFQGASDLSLLGNVAEMPHDRDGPCPNLNVQDLEVQKGGKPAVTRTWYCLSDPSDGSLIEDLTVCSDCVGRHNLIFSCLNRIFQPVANGQKVQATCDLLTGQNYGSRGDHYLDKIIETAAETLKTRTRDTRVLAEFVKKWAPIPICLKSQHVPQGAVSYTFPTSIPNYAVCQECYTCHILPLIESASPPPILRELRPNVSPTGFVCDLYSPRLLQYFNDACASNDIRTYKQRILARESKMQEYNVKLEQMKLQYQQHNRQAEIYRIQSQMAKNTETVRVMQWSASAYYAPPVSIASSPLSFQPRLHNQHPLTQGEIHTIQLFPH